MSKKKIDKIYKIEYGKETYYKARQKGRDFHVTRPLTYTQANLLLQKLNKIWDYTTVLKLKNGEWEAIG